MKTEGKYIRVVCKARGSTLRPNKVAAHYQRKARIIDKDLNTLAVRGTLDCLGSRTGLLSISKLIKVEHPVDKGYFKEVYVLSKYGRVVLNNRKRGIKSFANYLIQKYHNNK